MATCSASDLLASGSCFQCLTKKELQIVIAQLLCEIQSSGGGGGSSPKVYRALVGEVGTADPVSTVLENSLGGTPVWTRNAIGDYNLTLAGAFPAGKCFLSCNVDHWNSAVWTLQFQRIDNNSINLVARNAILDSVDLEQAEHGVGILVYP